MTVLQVRISYRNLEEMLDERSVDVDHTTVYRWVYRYAPQMDCRYADTGSGSDHDEI